MNTNTFIKTISAAFLATYVAGCVPLTAASTAVVGTTLMEERTTGDKIDDNLIIIKIKESFLQAETNEIFGSISVNSVEGRVLLTGSVKEDQYKNQAEELAWKITGVKEVINEIEVSQKQFSDRANDVYISSAIRSKLLLEKDLRSVNYVIDVNRGNVYLLGIAQDDNELRRALKIASTVSGVKRVVNYVILKDDPRRLQAGLSKKKET